MNILTKIGKHRHALEIQLSLDFPDLKYGVPAEVDDRYPCFAVSQWVEGYAVWHIVGGCWLAGIVQTRRVAWAMTAAFTEMGFSWDKPAEQLSQRQLFDAQEIVKVMREIP